MAVRILVGKPLKPWDGLQAKTARLNSWAPIRLSLRAPNSTDIAGRCWRPRPRPSAVAQHNRNLRSRGAEREPPSVRGDGGCLPWQPPVSKPLTGGGVARREPLIESRHPAC